METTTGEGDHKEKEKKRARPPEESKVGGEKESSKKQKMETANAESTAYTKSSSRQGTNEGM